MRVIIGAAFGVITVCVFVAVTLAVFIVEHIFAIILLAALAAAALLVHHHRRSRRHHFGARPPANYPASLAPTPRRPGHPTVGGPRHVFGGATPPRPPKPAATGSAVLSMTNDITDRERIWTDTQEWLDDIDRDGPGVDLDAAAPGLGPVSAGDDDNPAPLPPPAAASPADIGDDDMTYQPRQRR